MLKFGAEFALRVRGAVMSCYMTVFVHNVIPTGLHCTRGRTTGGRSCLASWRSSSHWRAHRRRPTITAFAQAPALRVYEGACGGETGIRYGVPFYYLWTDAEIEDLCGATFETLNGCTLAAYSDPGWRPAAHLVTTYDPAANAWSLPEIIEMRRVFLPLMEVR